MKARKRILGMHPASKPAKILCAVVLCFCSVAYAEQPPPEYKFNSIDVPGAKITVVEGINDLGHVVGSSMVDVFDPRSTGFVFADGQFRTINVPGATSLTPQSINKHGSIVGSLIEDGIQKAFLLENDQLTIFDVPASEVCLSSAFTINNRGQIVGEYLDQCDVGNRQHGFLYDDGKFSSIDFPGADGTVVNGINNEGDIVGFFYGAPAEGMTTSGFVKKNERVFRVVDVPFPGTTSTSVNGINNDGDMVGTFSSSSLGVGSFVFVNRKFVELEFPSAFMTIALAINKRGQIAGFYIDGQGGTHGFIATPVKNKNRNVN
jgi:uncharacterized membrane protein